LGKIGVAGSIPVGHQTGNLTQEGRRKGSELIPVNKKTTPPEKGGHFRGKFIPKDLSQMRRAQNLKSKVGDKRNENGLESSRRETHGRNKGNPPELSNNTEGGTRKRKRGAYAVKMSFGKFRVVEKKPKNNQNPADLGRGRERSRGATGPALRNIKTAGTKRIPASVGKLC